MHHLIFPSQDTYITNTVGSSNKNFGIDEILQVGTSNVPARILSQTKDYSYNNAIFNHQQVDFFTGIFAGTLTGTVIYATGSLSGSNLIFSSSYFSGSIDGNPVGGSGSFSGSYVSGTFQGNIIANAPIGMFIGILTGSVGCLTGTTTGIDTRNQPNWTTATTQYVNRSLLQFDLNAISTSIVNNTITSASFHLKVKVCNEYQLPITYTIYAFPVSQSWDMGNGYFSDNGSTEGVNWIYRDNDGETLWSDPRLSGSRLISQTISDPAQLTTSFSYGGGTFYTTPICTQQFEYETSDIDMDVTSIVNAWLSKSIPNDGLILLSSDELTPTGSGFVLKFFSRDTNTIYSPYLDVAWDDTTFVTGSIYTGSNYVITQSGGGHMTVQSGSSFSIYGGLSGQFSGSAAIVISTNYLTASAFGFNQEYVRSFSGSFTGSFQGVADNTNGIISSSGQFSASYFTGSIDGFIFELSGSVSGSNISGIISSSIISDQYISNYEGFLSASTITLFGTASGIFLDTVNQKFQGFISGEGIGGQILGVPVFGQAAGIISMTHLQVSLPSEIVYSYPTSPMVYPYVVGYNIPTNNSPYDPVITSQYVWLGFDSGGWASLLPVLPSFVLTSSCGPLHDVQAMTASFTSGPFSGSRFVAYYSNAQILLGTITGPWIADALYGATVTFALPSPTDPWVIAYVYGPYINGHALGMYILSDSTSASFNGQFTDGNTVGGTVSLQLTGSIYTSSFSYTASMITSSNLAALDIQRPYAVTLQNVYPVYKSGDIVKIGIFGRKLYPQKFFGISGQQEQYLVPEYLPTSSYYALKDNLTEEIVINFDSYTRIGCEYPLGNFFILDTTGLPQDRYYRILIRIEDSKNLYTIDTGKIFKLTR